MFDPILSTLANNPGEPCPSLDNPAVARCVDIWERAYQAHTMKRNTGYNPDNIAGKAYRRAMPPLTGYQNICDFIACVGYGLLIGAVHEDSAGKLLYAAQVAFSTLPKPSKAPPAAG